MTCPSQLMVAAYEPSQGLRVQIALLYASRSQGADSSSCSMGVLNVTNFCVIASDGVKKELVSQNKHEPDDSVSIRFRRETYDAPEIGIASGVSPLDVKQELQGVQEQAPVTGPSQALWDECPRYQSNLRKLDDPGMPRCLDCVPDASSRLYKTFISSLSSSDEPRALCPGICGTNPYHSIINEPPSDHLISLCEALYLRSRRRMSRVSDRRICAALEEAED